MNENQMHAMEFFLRSWTKETGMGDLIRNLKNFMRKIGDGAEWGNFSALDRFDFYCNFLTTK